MDNTSLNQKILPSPQVSQVIDLVPDIENLNNYATTLEALNQVGNDVGYSFKNGQSALNIAKTIICQNSNRNRKGSLYSSRLEEDNDGAKLKVSDVDCRAYYRFRINNDGTVILTTYNQQHNYSPTMTDKQEVRTQMKTYLRENSKKLDHMSDVKDQVEVALTCKVDYWKIYKEFRRLYPRLGSKECENFVKFWDENGYLHAEETKPSEESL